MLKKSKIIKIVGYIVIIAIVVLSGEKFDYIKDSKNIQSSYEITDVPEYSSEIYVTINNNIPNFTSDDLKITKDYYSKLEDGKVRNGYGKN